MHNFKVIACDTDSIFFKKSDGSVFLEDEIKFLNNELNSLMPKRIKWEMNGYFRKKITFRAKNYILFDGQTIKSKGSALRSSTREPAIKEFMNAIVDSIIYEKNDYQQVYNRYIKEAMNVTDIRRWVSKKTLTKAVYESERSNETKIKDAVEGTDHQPGDRVYLFFKEDETLCLAEQFDGNYDKIKLVKKLFEASKLFNTVLPKDTFINYALKKNKDLLLSVIS